MSNRQKRQAGFTLVEILVVIVIIGLLATIVGSNVVGSLLDSKEKIAKTQVMKLRDVVKEYFIRENRIPESLEILLEKNEKGRAYMEDMPKDPWQNDYILRPGEQAHEFEILCLGPDGDEGTEDDISSVTNKDN